jgi:hypothetical protein
MSQDFVGIVSHFPPYPLLAARPPSAAYTFHLTVEALQKRDGEPPPYPELLREELSDPEAAARTHHRELTEGFVEFRELLEAYSPDVVLIVGDDQGEIFKAETSIPQVLVSGAETHYGNTMIPGPPGGVENQPITLRGDTAKARLLVNALRQMGHEVAWTTDGTIGHSVTNLVSFLYSESDGTAYSWPWPTVPIFVNSYGDVMTASGGNFQHRVTEGPYPQGFPYLDPVGFTPTTAVSFGRALRIAREDLGEDLRVAVLASGSWSHAFLADSTLGVYPDLGGDRRRFEELQAGRAGEEWAKLTLADVHNFGLQEFLHSVMVFAGAYPERTPNAMCDLVETALFNSPKCFAVSLPE